MRAEIHKLAALHERLMMQTRWYPLVYTATLIVVILKLAKAFL